MKYIITLIASVVAGSLIWLLYLRESASTYDSTKFATPEVRIVEDKRLINGKLYPENQIDVKSQISGVATEIFVKSGDKLRKGDKILQIQIIPDPEKLDISNKNLEIAKIAYETELKVYNRDKTLLENNVISRK